ncbi:MAG: right-handed parallel beta-helix repeat-containing protein [Bryobacteraceae bacterium]
MHLAAVLLAISLCSNILANTAQINVSRDLVTLGIASQNLVPDNRNLDARPLFQAALDFALLHGIHRVVADRGAYYFLTPEAPDHYMSIEGYSDLTVDLQGSDVYMAASYLIWLSVIDCNRITLTGFTLDSLQLPFTQVRVTGVIASQRTLTYSTLPGWPSPTTFNSIANPDGSSQELLALVFRNGMLVPGTNLLPISSPLRDGELQVTPQDEPWTQPGVLATYQPGDTVVFMARGAEAPILIEGGDGNILRDVDVYSSGAIAVHLDNTSNAQVRNVRVMPRPSTDHLISSNADGIHLSYALANNHVYQCFISHTVDDGIAINSPFLAFVDSQLSPAVVQVDRNFQSIFPNGLPVLFVNMQTAETMPGAQIQQQDPMYSDPADGSTATLTLTQSVGVLQSGFGMLNGTAQNRGAGSVIELNTVEDVLSARGIYLGGVQGVTVQRNLIRRTDCGAIVAHEDLAAYPVGPAQDIQILDNTVEDAIGPAAVGTGTVAAIASIFVLSTDENFSFVPATPNTNITIANNSILNSGRGAIWISNLNGGLVEGNYVCRYYRYPRLAAWGLDSDTTAQLLADFTQGIVVRSSLGVVVQNNDVEQKAFRCIPPPPHVATE